MCRFLGRHRFYPWLDKYPRVWLIDFGELPVLSPFYLSILWGAVASSLCCFNLTYNIEHLALHLFAIFGEVSKVFGHFQLDCCPTIEFEEFFVYFVYSFFVRYVLSKDISPDLASVLYFQSCHQTIGHLDLILCYLVKFSLGLRHRVCV